MLEQTEVTALRWSKPSADTSLMHIFVIYYIFHLMNGSFHSYYAVKFTFGDKTGDM